MRALQSIPVAGVLVSLALPGIAHGAKPPKKAAVSPAAALLAEGRQLMTAGNYAEACPKIAESQSQAPSPVTAMTLASCYQKAGKLVMAWTTYRTVADPASLAKKKKVALAAKRMADAFEPKLSHLTIKAQDASGTEVRCDGETVSENDWGSAVPRDGGGHDIEATAPGKKAWKKHIELAESGQNLEVDVPRLESEAPEPALSTSAGAETTGETRSRPSRGGTQRIVGVSVGGAGVAALVLGTYAGLHANSTYKEAVSACGGTTSCSSSSGLSLRNSASSWATVSTMSFLVGGAALAGGAVLFLMAPRDAQAPTVGVAPAGLGTGLSVVGRF